MDLENVRAFVAVAESTQFQSAGVRLGISQQAVSKRVAALERELNVRLFARTPRGALTTLDGRALLPKAMELLRAEARALEAARPDRRSLRVDVINVKLIPGKLMHEFHDHHPDVALELVTLFDSDSAIAQLLTGNLDATFRASPLPGSPLPRGITAQRVCDEPLRLLTGPEHPLAARTSVPMAELAEHALWMPSIVTGTEWAIYYAELARTFQLTLDSTGIHFGGGAMRDALLNSPALATFAGSHRSDQTSHKTRLIKLTDPTPVYPHSLLRHETNHHPALAALGRYLDARYEPLSDAWAPRLNDEDTSVS